MRIFPYFYFFFSLFFISIASDNSFASDHSFPDPSFSAKNTELILKDTTNGNRYHAVKALAPYLKEGLSGSEIVEIVGSKSTNYWRAKMIIMISEKAKSELSGSDVVTILGDMADGNRHEAIKALFPKIKIRLTAAEFANIVGSNSSQYWRSSMIKILAKKYGSNSNISRAIAPMGQMNFSDYRRNEDSADKFDSEDGYKVKYLSCLATVFAMIETAFGNTDAKIDDFYVYPSDGKSPGAFIPEKKAIYEPLSGYKMGEASFTMGSEVKYNRDTLNRALDSGQLVILHDSEGTKIEQHFVLVKRYNKANGIVSTLVINDPLSGTEKTINAIGPKLKNYEFDSMRLVSKQ